MCRVLHLYNGRVLLCVEVCVLWWGYIRPIKGNIESTHNCLIARFMGSTWGPSGADRTQVGPTLAPWTLQSGWPSPPVTTGLPSQRPVTQTYRHVPRPSRHPGMFLHNYANGNCSHVLTAFMAVDFNDFVIHFCTHNFILFDSLKLCLRLAINVYEDFDSTQCWHFSHNYICYKDILCLFSFWNNKIHIIQVYPN